MSWGHSECGKWSGRTFHGALLTELLSQWGWGCWRGEHPRTVTLPVSACPLLFRCGSLPLPLTPLPLYLLFSGNCPPVGESQSPSGQSSAPAPPPRLNPSASSPNFFKYLKHNPSGEQSGNAVPKRWAARMEFSVGGLPRTVTQRGCAACPRRTPGPPLVCVCVFVRVRLFGCAFLTFSLSFESI